MFSPIIIRCYNTSNHAVVIIDFYIVEWVVQRGKNYLTCKNNNRISQYSADLATCQADAEAAGATHIFWQSAEYRPGGDWCHLYASCDEDDLRTPSEQGVTYYLDAAKGWTVKTFRTCSTDERIFQNNLNLENCKAKAEELGAARIYWQANWQRASYENKNLCHVYSTCNGNNLRIPSLNGVNMQNI